MIIVERACIRINHERHTIVLKPTVEHTHTFISIIWMCGGKITRTHAYVWRKLAFVSYRIMENWISSSPIKPIALWLMKHFYTTKTRTMNFRSLSLLSGEQRTLSVISLQLFLRNFSLSAINCLCVLIIMLFLKAVIFGYDEPWENFA